jgi:hypothetical protein
VPASAAGTGELDAGEAVLAADPASAIDPTTTA